MTNLTNIIAFASDLDFVEVYQWDNTVSFDVADEADNYNEDLAFELFKMCGEPTKTYFGSYRFNVDGFEVIFAYDSADN